MQCENCGRPLRPGETICPMCGEPVWPEEPEQPTLNARRGIRLGALQVGPPVDPYAPTVFGPQAPVGRRTPPVQAPPYGPSPRPRWDDASPHPLWPSPEEAFAARAPRRRRNTGCLPLVGLAAGLVVVALLVTGALAASGQLQGILGPGPGTSGQQPQAQSSATARPTVAPTATAAPICSLKPVDPTAAKAVKNVQLASGLRDPGQQDLRPVNNLKNFHPGQMIYVTFQIATSQPGTIAADLCTPGDRYDGSKAVPPDFQNGRGEFSSGAPLAAPQDLGPGAVTLTWNGAVAAVLPFQVANS
jgi:hypothetical protein